MLNQNRGYIGKLLLLIAVFSLILSLRFISLDQDFPGWEVSNFQPMDEYAYTSIAFNLFRNGEFNIDGGFAQEQTIGLPNTRVNLLQNLVTYFSLKVWGNNYYGLRVPAAVFSALSIILFSIFLLRLNLYQIGSVQKVHPKNYFLIALFILYLILDFTFLLTSRIAEPTIFRASFLMLILSCFFWLEKKPVLNFFVLGFLATLSVLLIYVVNAFIIIASALTLLAAIGFYGRRMGIRAIGSFCFGIGLAWCLSEIYYQSIWHISSIENVKQILEVFKNGRLTLENPSLSNFIVKYVENSTKFLKANIFIYSPPLLLLFFFSIPVSIFGIVKSKSLKLTFLASLTIAMYAQTIVLNDYTTRKLTTILPIILLNIYVAITYFREYLVWLKGLSRRVFIFYQIVSWLVVLRLAKTYLLIIPNLSQTTKWILIGVNTVAVTAVLLMVLFFAKRPDYKFSNVCFKLMFLLIISSNVFLSCNFVYLNRQYSEKYAMTQIGEIARDKYVLGGFAHSFSLYNDTRPVLSYWDSYRGAETYEDKFREYLFHPNVQYYVDFSGSSKRLDSLTSGTPYKFVPIKEFERTYTEGGKKTILTLFQKVLRNTQ